MNSSSAADIADARLRYVHDDRPGISRVRRGKAFAYLDQHGHTITDEKTLARISALAIPPAYEKV